MNKLLAAFLLIGLYTLIPSVSYASYTMHIFTEQKDGGVLADNSIVFVDKGTSVEPLPTSPVPAPEPTPEPTPEEEPEEEYKTIYQSSFIEYQNYRYASTNGSARLDDFHAEYFAQDGYDGGDLYIYLKMPVEGYNAEGFFLVDNGGPNYCYFYAERCDGERGCGGHINPAETAALGYKSVLMILGRRDTCYADLHTNDAGYKNLRIRQWHPD